MNVDELRLSNLWLPLPGFLLAILGTVFGMYWLINVDAASLLSFAARMLKGGKLYQDVVDTQVPTIYLISLFVVWLSKIIEINVINSFFCFVFLLSTICIYITWQILKQNILFKTPAPQTILIFILSYSVFILPFLENNWHLSFGEREHLFCVLILPYLASIFNRLESTQTKLAQLVTAGVLAGIGFSIKPHFWIILATSELYLIFRSKNVWNWLRMESLIIFGMLSVYILGIIFLTPQYLTLIPYFLDCYKGYEISKVLMLQICAVFSILPLLILIWFLIEQKLNAYRKVIPYLFSLSFASLIVYALGRGAFYYHIFPFKFITVLLLAFVFCTHPRKMFLCVFGMLLVAVTLKFGFQHFTDVKEKRDFVFRLSENIRQHAKHGSVISFDSGLAPAFPAVTYANVSWGLSFSGLIYPIPFAYREYREKNVAPDYHLPEEMGKTERFFHEKLIYDFEKHAPTLVMVNISPQKEWLGKMQFDFIQYFSKDPRFVNLWKNYKWVSRVSNPSQTMVFDFYHYKPLTNKDIL